jgi:alpha-1,6-mannosyltransferase
MQATQQHRKFIIPLITGLTMLVYLILLYQLPRSNFFAIYLSFLLLFASYFYIVKDEQLFSLEFCIGLAVLLRLFAVFSLPALSDDYFRFIWDGKMFLHHVNPFSFTPKEYLSAHKDGQLQFLYNNLIPESQESYTIYPAVLQYIFAIAAKLFPANPSGAAVVMKLFIFMSECFTLYGLLLLSKGKNVPSRNILWYALNPLVIVELTGNVHFEALMICFLLFTFYFLEKNKIVFTALFWALAICSKILPVMLAPLFLIYLGFWRFFKTGLLTVVFTTILFIPLINHQLFAHLSDSVGKYYNLFEFNGSFYYLFVRISQLFSDNDYSAQIASMLGAIALVLILFISFFKFKKEVLFENALWIFFIYFLSAAMVHPWYISTLVSLGVFTKYKFPVVFSLLIPLSYFPYWLKVYNENMWVILLEYSLLLLFVLSELKINNGKTKGFMSTAFSRLLNII